MVLGQDNVEDMQGITLPTGYKSEHGNFSGLHKEDFVANSVNVCTKGIGFKFWYGFHAKIT